jgi:hypothetical protein
MVQPCGINTRAKAAAEYPCPKETNVFSITHLCFADP